MRVARVATRQMGVVTNAQLKRCGLSARAIEGRIAKASLHPLYRGVYAVGHTSISPNARYLAAVLACGPQAALSHRSAADLWGLRRNEARIEVTVPRRRAGHPGIVTYRSRMMDSADFTSLDRIPVTSVARTLLDLAAVLSPRALGYALDRAERLELFDLTKMEELLERAGGRAGLKVLRRAIAEWRPSYTRGELEDRFQELVAGAGLPLSQVNVLIEGEAATHEVDCYWPGERLIVQLDGFAYHRTSRDRERDASTDADLELAGYRVKRLTWNDIVKRRRGTEQRVRRLLRPG